MAFLLITWNKNVFGDETLTARGKNPTSIGHARDVVVNNDDAKSALLHTENKIINLADVSKLNTLQRHQDALLIAQNPTKIIVSNAEFLQWVSDSEPFLTITFSNISKLPASKVEYGISGQMYAGPSKSARFLPIIRSSAMPKSRNIDYGIDPGQTLVAPLISISDLRKFLRLKSSDCIVTSRVVEGAMKFPDLPFKQGQLNSATDYAIGLVYKYRSIFEQKYITNTVLSVIVANRDSLAPPGPAANEAYLQCRD